MGSSRGSRPQAYYPAPVMCGGEFTPGHLAAWQSQQRNQPCYIGFPRYQPAAMVPYVAPTAGGDPFWYTR